MNNYTFNHKGYTFERINKRQARKAYMNGLTVVICPCNLVPFSPWHSEYAVNRKSRESFVIDEIGMQNDFNNLIASYEYYNCPNKETGKYAAFYIPVEYVDRFTGEAPTVNTIGTVKQYAYEYVGK